MKLAVTGKTMLLVAGFCLLSSCSRAPSTMNGAADEGGASSFGMGQRMGFSSQQAGEYFTTRAPHNQTYLFPFDNASLDKKYIPSLKAQAAYLRLHSGARVLIAGHTDERGSREYNVALGERRANTVAQLLRLAGVSGKQVRVVSYGKERPVAEGHDENAHSQNRRVELIYEATR